MKITVFQTSDMGRYRRMLEATQRTALEYCRRHGHAYESFIGVKRGFHPWQATFNRLFLFREMLDRKLGGWALYMDADAYFVDLDFDLSTYLAGKADRLSIMVTIPGAEEPWRINAGVILLNLDHPLAGDLVDRWMERFMALSDETMRETVRVLDWDNDQHMLYLTLAERQDIRDACFFETSGLMNSHDATFIRQFLAAFEHNVEERIAAIERMVDEVMGGADGSRPPAGPDSEALVRALYRAVLGREPDPQGLADYEALVRDAGPVRGVEEAVAGLLASAEYRGRRAPR